MYRSISDRILFEAKEALAIEGIEPPRQAGWLGKFPGYIRPELKWEEVVV
jgi:hypothetical protein